MRRHDIVSGILLILSTINFAFAAPVLVQEKRQAGVDLVHIPREVITVLGKRGLEGVGKLMEELVETSEKPVELSDAHTSSSSALPVPDHGLTNEAEAPETNPASSPTNPDPLMGPSSPSPTADSKPVSNSAPPVPDHGSTNEAEAPAQNPASSPPNPDPLMEHLTQSETGKPMEDSEPFESSGTHAPSGSALPVPDHGSMNDVKAPEPNPGLSPANPYPLMESPNPSGTEDLMPEMDEEELTDSDYEWVYGDNELLVPMTSQTPAGSGWDHELTEALAPQPEPNSGPPAGADPDFDWNHWENGPSPPRKRPASGADPDFDWKGWADAPSPPQMIPAMPKEFGQAHENNVEHIQQPDSGPSVTLDLLKKYSSSLENQPPLKRPKLASSKEFGQAHDDQVVVPYLSNTGPSTDLVLHQENDLFDLDDLLHQLKNAPPEPELSAARPLSPGTPSPLFSLWPPPGLPGPMPPPPSPELTVSDELTDPELHSGHEWLSTDSQPVGLPGLLDAIYGAKGKAKELRRIPGTARDVGNAANAAQRARVAA